MAGARASIHETPDETMRQRLGGTMTFVPIAAELSLHDDQPCALRARARKRYRSAGTSPSTTPAASVPPKLAAYLCRAMGAWHLQDQDRSQDPLVCLETKKR